MKSALKFATLKFAALKFVKMTAIALVALGVSSVAEPLTVRAQNNIVLYGGGKEGALSYNIRSSRPGARLNTFNFYAKLPNKAVAELQVLYPENFGHVFLSDDVRILSRSTQKPLKVREVLVDKEAQSVRYVFDEPVPAIKDREVEIIISGVSNPNYSGMYRVQVQALGTEANPLFQYLGQWLVTIY